ncbi:unannotated protein [freshwater metagenome]|uniref:Unannotated protein n=1 Tax=freshwater metagenome TaxID=449393 RepID=A0A6J7C5U0_9ZZZZ
MRSNAIATAKMATPTRNERPGLRSFNVSINSAPSPPAPTSAPMTTMPMQSMIVWFIAVTNDLIACGACTFQSNCQRFDPKMRPASTDAGGTWRIPSATMRIIGGSPKMMVAMAAGTCLIPKSKTDGTR